MLKIVVEHLLQKGLYNVGAAEPQLGAADAAAPRPSHRVARVRRLRFLVDKQFYATQVAGRQLTEE